MEYSLVEIKRIESYYNIKLPVSYKRMMMLIGRKILNNLPRQESYYGSIYRIQEKNISLTEDDENDITYKLKNVFFITNSLTYYPGVESSVVCFIEPRGQNDCPVNAWIYDGSAGESSIEKISDGIEEWLEKISCTLYLELQVRKIFNRSLLTESGY
jgi:hypothetical protein